jgi:hypothetical protein
MRVLSEEDEMQVGPGLIVTIVFLALFIVFYCSISCIVRCFYPDMTKGPEWFVNPRTGGSRWLRPPKARDFFCCCLSNDLVQEAYDTKADDKAKLNPNQIKNNPLLQFTSVKV